MKHFLEKCLLQEWIGYHYRIIYELLVRYYNDTYDWNFVSIAELSSDLSTNNSRQSIVVLPNVDQFGRIRIATEIFGSSIAPRYQRSSYILAKFIQDDETIDIYLVKCNIILNIQFSFQLVPKHIDLLLLNGICGLQMSE